MKRFSILCCLVLLLNMLCPVGHVHAETVATPTDLCQHTYNYWADEDECVYGCTVCKMELSRSEHEASCLNPGVCTACGYEDESMLFYHESHSFTYSDESHSWYCNECGTPGPGEEPHTFTTSHGMWVDGISHWVTCDVCRYSFTEKHDPNGDGSNVNWSHDDDGNHYGMCKDCYYLVYSGQHAVPCTDRTRTYCETCGYEGVIEQISHDYDSSGICINCNEECNHCGWEDGFCTECGAECEHNWSEWYNETWYDGEGNVYSNHMRECSVCRIGYGWPHEFNCKGVCATCGYKDDTEGAEYDHYYEAVSLGADGHKYVCNGCGQEQIINDVLRVDTHTASCSEPGVCWDCGYESDDMALAHLFEDFANRVVESDDDYHWFTCLNCGEVKEEHTWTLNTAVIALPLVAATCTTDGSDTYTCLFCGTHKVEVVPATGHTYGYWADGDKCVYGCTVCKMEISRREHTAACTNPGVCTVCGYEGEIANLLHNYGWFSNGATTHTERCIDCGYIDEDYVFVGAHRSSCKNPTICMDCGYEGEISIIRHSSTLDAISDGITGHHYECSDCGAKESEYHHEASCTDPTHCSICDYEGVIFENDIEHSYGELESFGEEGCGYVCIDCGSKLVTDHYADCSDPNHCAWCGYAGNFGDVEHFFDYCDNNYNEEGHTYVCTKCGYELFEAHVSGCDMPNTCDYCYYRGEIANTKHCYSTAHEGGYDDNYHRTFCGGCGEVVTEEHQWDEQPIVVEATSTTDGSKTYICKICCKTKVEVIPATGAAATATPEPTAEPTSEPTSEPTTEPTAEPTVEPTAEPTEEPTPEPTEAPTAEPTAEPTVNPTAEPAVTATPTPVLDYEPDETATPAPTNEPEATDAPVATNEPEATEVPAATDKPEATDAPVATDEPEATDAPVATDEPEATEVPAAENDAEDVHVHGYGICASNANGTHSQTCDCGDVVTSACTMVDTKIGNLDASACIYCGYITWKLDAVADDAQGEGLQEGMQDATIVENVVFELVDEAGESIATESFSLVVYESAPEATIVLDTGVNAIVKKALTITVLEDSTPVKLANTVKLSIPMEDDITGLKLLVMDENGELVEIEYEVIDGVMVFETNILGIFMLVQEI